MGKTIYIQCYEGLSAKMMVEALLNLMPEQTQAKATVDQLLTLNCPAEVKAAMIRKLPRKSKILHFQREQRSCFSVHMTSGFMQRQQCRE